MRPEFETVAKAIARLRDAYDRDETQLIGIDAAAAAIAEKLAQRYPSFSQDAFLRLCEVKK